MQIRLLEILQLFYFKGWIIGLIYGWTDEMGCAFLASSFFYASPGYDHILNEDITASILEETNDDLTTPDQKSMLFF